jgi:hypothetical protein
VTLGVDVVQEVRRTDARQELIGGPPATVVVAVVIEDHDAPFDDEVKETLEATTSADDEARAQRCGRDLDVADDLQESESVILLCSGTGVAWERRRSRWLLLC